MAAETRRILLVEDEKTIRDAVAAYLERESYWVTPAADGQVAIDEFTKHRFDLVVLDLMLPKVSGEEVCRQIRNASDVPIIMLTAKGEEEDRIAGLELGADDYLVKPFSPRELVARVRALLRRAHVDSEPQRDRLVFGDLEIDVAGHKAFLASEELDLTASEFKLLTTLVALSGSRVLAHGARREGPRLRLRGLRAHHRLAREEPARQARRRPQGADLHLHRPRRGLPVRAPEERHGCLIRPAT